jgi:fimbrial chaperone protein
MVMSRALVAMFALCAMTPVVDAQTGGIQVAPVLVAMNADQRISSLRLRNGRDRAVAFEVDAYTWTQINGVDQLTPTRDLLIAPGVFEIPAQGEQMVRLAARGGDVTRETAYRIVLRELPRPDHDGVALGFTLEMSLPVFVTPRHAQANIETRIVGDTLVLSNAGAGYAQVSLFDGEERLRAPRYLLAGSSAQIRLPAHARALRLVAAGAQTHERTINVGRQDHSALVR